jgi:hypothetical protein
MNIRQFLKQQTIKANKSWPEPKQPFLKQLTIEANKSWPEPKQLWYIYTI